MKPPTRIRSREAFQRACRVIPGGVNSPARAFGGVGGQPIFIARGEGPYLFDIDGNRYLDYVGSWGPLILGHCSSARGPAPSRRRCASGASFGAPTERGNAAGRADRRRRCRRSRWCAWSAPAPRRR